MEISTKIKKFIEENREDINENNFSELYRDLLAKDVTTEEYASFTKLLLAAGIDPLLYMEKVPDCYLYASDIREIYIPDSIKEIGRNAFDYCRDLKKVTWSPNLEKIGNEAFIDSGIVEARLPSGVYSLGRHVFSGCKDLREIALPSHMYKVPDAAFFGCSSLESIEIPSNIREIGFIAFHRCYGLKQITLNKGLARVGERGIPSGIDYPGLKEIKYNGTKEDWKKIKFDSPLEINVRCSDGIIENN